jgi:hypothetical protein
MKLTASGSGLFEYGQDRRTLIFDFAVLKLLAADPHGFLPGAALDVYSRSFSIDSMVGRSSLAATLPVSRAF